ncbi:MAG: hypothetical protein KGL58_03705, partial [Pseudomonadota bacterium]|nr:hypothetical protein [Pseudomonadota bacterium]
MAPQSSIWRVSFFRLLSRIVLLLLLVTIKGDQTINEAGTFIHRPEVKSFIEFMHQRYNMKLSRLRELFSQVSPRPKVTRSTPNPVSSLG